MHTSDDSSATQNSSLAALKPDRFHVLDGMRGIAAVLVMLFHYFQSAMGRYTPNVFMAVDFFFILSGFVVAHAYGDRLRRGMRWGDYVSKRIARLTPSMAIGLLVGTVVLFVAHHQGVASYTPVQSLGSLVLNLCYIPYLNHGSFTSGGRANLATIFPADTPLWSIFFEMCASLSFLLLARVSVRLLLVVCVVGLLLGLGFSGFRGAVEGSTWFVTNNGFALNNLLGGFPRVIYGFACGMLLNRLYHGRWRRGEGVVGRLKAPPVLLYALLFGVLLFPSQLEGLYFFVAAALLSPLLVAFGSKAIIRNRLVLVVSEWLGVISYPLYCIHEPTHRILGGAMRILHFPERAKILADLCSILVTVLAAWFIAVFVERRIQAPLLAGLRRLLDRESSAGGTQSPA